MRPRISARSAIGALFNASAIVVFVAWCAGAAGQRNGDSAADARCGLPKLFVVPPKDEIAGNGEDIKAAAKTYFEGIAAYSACLQAELSAAGGDTAPSLIKQILIRRNNTAVEEANFMMKRVTDTFGAAATPAPVASSTPAPAAR